MSNIAKCIKQILVESRKGLVDGNAFNWHMEVASIVESRKGLVDGNW